ALKAALLALAGSPNLCSRRWVTEQYDSYVLGATVAAPPADAGVLRLSEDGAVGVALSLDGNCRYAQLDPYLGAQLAVAEAYRNVASVGARPLAATNCLNFGSPEDPEVMWQFAQAVAGLADACLELGLPITGGNVSFYNQTGATAINPTPVVGVLGIVEDVRHRLRAGWQAGEEVYLLGETEEELGGSEWAWVHHAHLGGRPPRVRLGAEQALAQFLAGAGGRGELCGAHDVSDGGLGHCLVECALFSGVGATLSLPEGLDPFVALFSESAARVVVSAAPDVDVSAAAAAAGVPCRHLGRAGGELLDLVGLFDVPLAELRAAYEATLPALFG
ncbi:MAG: AIR synthase related protein, partial [Mycobacteriales bacterium]